MKYLCKLITHTDMNKRFIRASREMSGQAVAIFNQLKETYNFTIR